MYILTFRQALAIGACSLTLAACDSKKSKPSIDPALEQQAAHEELSFDLPAQSDPPDDPPTPPAVEDPAADDIGQTPPSAKDEMDAPEEPEAPAASQPSPADGKDKDTDNRAPEDEDDSE
jgi:hypothetical protein